MRFTDDRCDRYKMGLQSQQLDSKGNLKYINEATVADYAQDVVMMCLRMFGGFRVCCVLKEMSIFSLRPDLVIIQHSEHGIVLIIEVKMPGDNLMKSEHIAGQVADYLMGMTCPGNQRPFVLLSSYDKACLCHLMPDDVEGQNLRKYRSIVEDSSKILKNNKSFSVTHLVGSNTPGKKKNSWSPGRNAFEETNDIPSRPIKSQQRKRKRNAKNKVKVDYLKPKIMYSEPFSREKMIQGVSLALECGFQQLSERTSKFRFWPKQGEEVAGEHCWVKNENFGWAQLKGIFIDYTTSPALNGQEYFLIREIGRGNKGRVFLAVDKDGSACALKFYLHRKTEYENYSPEERKKIEKIHRAEDKAKIEKEIKRWKTLPRCSEYCEYIEHLELNSHQVLKMAALYPVPPAKREEIIDDIRVILENLLKSGFVYKEVCWSHFACDLDSKGKLNVVPLDLESLQCVEEENMDNHQQTIKTQIEELSERIQYKPPASSAMQL